MIDLEKLRQLGAVVLPLVQQFGGKDDRVRQLGDLASALLGGHAEAAPVKRDLDAALKSAAAERRAAFQGARDELKFKG